MKKSFTTLFMAILLGGLILSSCTKHYFITVRANNDDWGTVIGGGKFKNKDTTTIAARPNDGYKFVKWDDGNRESRRVITVTSNVTYTAIFEEPTVEPSAKVTFKGSEWEAGDIGGEYYVGNQTGWRVAAAPVSTHEFPKAECAAYVTTVGRYSDATTNGYDYQNNIISDFEYYESDVLFGEDGVIHGDWWAKSVDLRISAFDANNMRISATASATMFNAIEAFVDGVGIDNATTTTTTMKIINITLTQALVDKKKTNKRK